MPDSETLTAKIVGVKAGAVCIFRAAFLPVGVFISAIVCPGDGSVQYGVAHSLTDAVLTLVRN